MMKVTLWLAGIAVLLLGLDRLLLRMESRGWIYYRKKKPNPAALGGACLEVQQLLEPSRTYVIEVMKEEKKEQAESGDPPESGAGGPAALVRDRDDEGGPGAGPGRPDKRP
jgi:hypothetical protein